MPIVVQKCNRCGELGPPGSVDRASGLCEECFDTRHIVQCRNCKRQGSALDEFVSPYTGLCGQCSPPPAKAPPLGIMLRRIWLEHRQKELVAAIRRYQDAGKQVPTEWLDELEELAAK